jgi:hypothetical protein
LPFALNFYLIPFTTLFVIELARGKVKKAGLSPSALPIIEEDLKRIPNRGWAAMIRKVYEVNPLVCPDCGGTMKVIAFITDYDGVEPGDFLGSNS